MGRTHGPECVTSHPRNDPFGTEVNADGRPAPRALATSDESFTGHTLDRATGFIDAGGRIYDPRTRRFLTTDPLAGMGGSQSWDPFSYVQNNPSTLTDPSGFAPEGSFDITAEAFINDRGEIEVQVRAGGSGAARGSDAPVDINAGTPNHIVDDTSAGGVGEYLTNLVAGAGSLELDALRGPSALITLAYERTARQLERSRESGGYLDAITPYLVLEAIAYETFSATTNVPAALREGAQHIRGAIRDGNLNDTQHVLAMAASVGVGGVLSRVFRGARALPPATAGSAVVAVDGVASTAGEWRPPLGAAIRVPAEWGRGVPNGKLGVAGVRWDATLVRSAGRRGVAGFDRPVVPSGSGIRIDRGIPGSSFPSQRVDHVIVRRGGRIIGRSGSPLPGSGSISLNPMEAHIPVSEWTGWSTWWAP